jgi:hypothetical protein
MTQESRAFSLPAHGGESRSLLETVRRAKSQSSSLAGLRTPVASGDVAVHGRWEIKSRLLTAALWQILGRQRRKAPIQSAIAQRKRLNCLSATKLRTLNLLAVPVFSS